MRARLRPPDVLPLAAPGSARQPARRRLRCQRLHEEKYAMHETHERMQRNAVNIQEGMDKTDNNSPNYGSKEMVQR